MLISNFTKKERLEETESKSEEGPCLWADDYGKKKFIVQLLCGDITCGDKDWLEGTQYITVY